MIRKSLLTLLVLGLISISPCHAKRQKLQKKSAGAEGQVKLMTLDPGHFHAALVQKTTYEQVSPTVHVYAPQGPDVRDHLKRIEGFNKRKENPTNWRQKTYAGDDFLERMLTDRPGNVVVISGNNRKKAEYIKACVDAGLNVLADKPMCIDRKGFELLEQAFVSAKKNGVLLYDIMTERSSITTILQKELVHNKSVFGKLQTGTVDDPSVIKESVHHFFKYVAGNPIKRPGWYFDTTQQGEGIVDVTTHLVDLVMWGSFPGQAINCEKDIEIKKAQRRPTMITRRQYEKVTRLNDFPDFLKEKLDDKGTLPCYANGEIIFTVKGVHAKAAVTWNFQAPEGTKDTHYSLMKGTKAIVSIRQGKEQNYRPELYVEATAENKDKLGQALRKAVAELQSKYPGIKLRREEDIWHVLIPDKHRIGHEAHFRQVTERYLKYLEEGKLPQWEVPNMKTKYNITTKALQLASQEKCSKDSKVQFIKGDNKIDVMVGGKRLTSYLYGENLTKPILYPVHTPSGIVVNRSYPFAKVKGEEPDHPHHTGVFFTYDSVNSDGFWNNTTSPPQIRHVKVTEMKGQAGKGNLSTIMHWVGKSGQILLEERRNMLFLVGENEYAIDFSIDLTAQDTRVVFSDNKEGMFAIRVAHWLREKKGTGRYLSSNGDQKEKNVWGKRAKWVRLQGEKDGKTIGLAIFNHPRSVNYPTYWHARGYGLFSANPLGQYVFEKKWNPKNAKPFNLTLEPGESAHFRFRMVIYEGKRTQEQLEDRFKVFVKSIKQ